MSAVNLRVNMAEHVLTGSTSTHAGVKWGLLERTVREVSAIFLLLIHIRKG